MKMILMILLLFSAQINVHAQVEVDAYGSAVSIPRVKTNSKFKLRGQRVAIGAGTGGLLGRLGGSLEVRFTTLTSLTGTWGAAEAYQVAGVGIKRYLISSAQIQGYMKGGYSRWYSDNGKMIEGTTTPAFFGREFLNENERRNGIFSEDILYAGLGIQYVFDVDVAAGSSLYFEANTAFDLDDRLGRTNLGAGYQFYF